MINMTNKSEKYGRFFKLTILFILFTITIFTGVLAFISNSSNSLRNLNILPPGESAESPLEAKAPPSPYPSYTGSGTPRTATESLWQTQLTGGNATNGFPLVFDLPGTGYWDGTRFDLTIDNIYEEKNWLINSDFASGLSSWTSNTDPTHTGPAISIGTDTSYGVDVGTHGDASYIRFASNNVPSTAPPQYTSTIAANTGDVGGTANWAATSTTTYADSALNGRVTGQNSGGSNNRDGAWRFYFADSETSSTDSYNADFRSTYTYSFDEFPVSSASFKFSYRYYSTDFDQGPACQGSYDGDRDKFTLYYSVYTSTVNLVDQQVMSWQSAGSTDPGDSGWIEIAPVDLYAAGLFNDGIGGVFYIEFRLLIEVDVDDGRVWTETSHDIWCNSEYECRDHNNEDSDHLYFYIDGVEMTVSVPENYGADVDPHIYQSFTFNNRNCTASTYLTLDYFIPTTFLSGRLTEDNGLYLDISINGQAAHRYSIRNTLYHDGAWHTLLLNWGIIGGDVGWNPGPSSISVEISIVFTVAGWFSQSPGQSMWFDNVVFKAINYAPADVAQLVCYDEENGNAVLSWDSIAERTCSLTHSGSWQTATDSSRFWLNSTSSASIWLESVTATFYATNHYPTITPTFDLPTNGDGRTPTVTWTMTYNVQAIAIDWHYNLTIPNIPDWSISDWDVVSVKDSTNADVNFWEISTGGGMKNLSIYTSTEDSTGIWTITCESPNKISDFDVENQDFATSYEYYPGFSNASRITFSTAARQSSSALITVDYTMPNGSAVDPGIYPNSSIQHSQSYNMSFWNIPDDAIANDHYTAIVTWVDNDGAFNDEVGFAAHYIQVYRNVAVSAIQFYQPHTLSSSNVVLAGEELQISINVTDILADPSLDLDFANLTIEYPDYWNPQITLQETLTMTKSGNIYSYDLQSHGGGADTWLITKAWMGGTGNRTFTISLFGNSTYLNGVFQLYEITSWFIIMVDTEYTLPSSWVQVEQGITFTLAVEFWDKTPAHDPATTTISDSDLINNRSSGIPITDLDEDGSADTWNGSVFMTWNLIPSNLTGWTGGDLGKINLQQYKWNGSLELKDGYANRYEARIQVPYDATPTVGAEYYYLNVTTMILDNSWGWKLEPQYMTLAYDNGQHTGPLGLYDDHIACFQLEVIEALGHDTTLELYPDNTVGDPLEHYWNNQTGELSRLYAHFYNTTNSQGFNSTILDSVDNWYVESWVDNYKVPDAFGYDLGRLQWQLVNSTTLLPDGITPDPHRENSSDPSSWGWFYADFNWTLVDLGIGTYLSGLSPAFFEMYVYARVENFTNQFRSSDGFHYIKVNPNPVNLTIALTYQSNPTFLDANYYGAANMTTTYYWGDMLNFTLDAMGVLENAPEPGISFRYEIYKSGIGTIKEDWINSTAITGRYSAIVNTSDPANGISWGLYTVYFRGIKENKSVEMLPMLFTLEKRVTWLVPELISGVFYENSIYDYDNLPDILAINSSRTYVPIGDLFRTVPNHTLSINVSLFDNTPRNGGPINEASIKWILRHYGLERMSGWSNISDNGIFSMTIDLHILTLDIAEIGDPFVLEVIPYKDNYDNELLQYPSGSTWTVNIRIGHRPIVLIPITPISMTYTQSNWANHPIQFVAQDPISGENISGCTINWRIEGTDLDGTYMEEYQPGHYQVVFNTWPSTFNWIGGGQYRLAAEIINTPSGIYRTSSDGWNIAELSGNNRIFLNVESEGFLGPLSMYFYIILGAIGLVVLGITSFISYKFLTTPYVVRKIEESINKISKDKKIAAGVMKSRDHLIFLEATEILRVVGVLLKPPPEKKLPMPILKTAPKISEEIAEKIPEIPIEVISEELDKAGVRPEEKPILLQQIKELGQHDRQEFVESLIGEDRFKEIVENLKAKTGTKKA